MSNRSETKCCLIDCKDQQLIFINSKTTCHELAIDAAFCPLTQMTPYHSIEILLAGSSITGYFLLSRQFTHSLDSDFLCCYAWVFLESTDREFGLHTLNFGIRWQFIINRAGIPCLMATTTIYQHKVQQSRLLTYLCVVVPNQLLASFP